MSFDRACKRCTDLTLEELYTLPRSHTEVFAVEQKCPYQEVDGLGPVGDTHYLMAWRDGQLFVYPCLLDPVRHEGQMMIGRVVSSPTARGQGLGRQLMERALQATKRLWLGTPVYLSAQAHLQDYYSRYGFVVVTGVYLEDDTPHIGMRRA